MTGRLKFKFDFNFVSLSAVFHYNSLATGTVQICS